MIISIKKILEYLLIIIVLLIIFNYIRKRKYKTNLYSNGKVCANCKSENILIKKISIFSNDKTREIYKKMNFLENHITEIIDPIVVFVFFVFIFFIILLKWAFDIFLLMVYYILMIIYPKKYKEYKYYVVCKDCGKISNLKNASDNSIEGEKIMNVKNKLNTAKSNIKIKKSKKTALILVSIFLLICSILICISLYKASNDAKLDEERKIMVYNEETKIVKEIVDSVASKYNIKDYNYDHLEVYSSEATFFLRTSNFQKLSDEDKLLFLVDLSTVADSNQNVFPDESFANGKIIDFEIISNEHNYYDFTFNNTSTLMEDGKEIITMETDFAKRISNSVSLSNNDDKSACKNGIECRTGFRRCGPDKNGYCNSCCKYVD